MNEDGDLRARQRRWLVNLSNASAARSVTPRESTHRGTTKTRGACSVGDVSVVAGNTGRRCHIPSPHGDTDMMHVSTSRRRLTATGDNSTTRCTSIDAGDTGATIDVVVNGDAHMRATRPVRALSDPRVRSRIRASGRTIRTTTGAPTVTFASAHSEKTSPPGREHAQAGLRIAQPVPKTPGRFVKSRRRPPRPRPRDRDGDGKPDGATRQVPPPKSKGSTRSWSASRSLVKHAPVEGLRLSAK